MYTYIVASENAADPSLNERSLIVCHAGGGGILLDLVTSPLLSQKVTKWLTIGIGK